MEKLNLIQLELEKNVSSEILDNGLQYLMLKERYSDFRLKDAHKLDVNIRGNFFIKQLVFYKTIVYLFFLGETYLRNFLKSGSTALKIANEFLATISGAMTIFGFILSVYMQMEFKVIKNERYEILKNSDIEAFNY